MQQVGACSIESQIKDTARIAARELTPWRGVNSMSSHVAWI